MDPASTPRMQAQGLKLASLRAESSTDQPIQCKWVNAGPDMLRWDPVESNMQWFYHSASGKLAFKFASRDKLKEVPESIASQEGIWREHGEWQQMGWGIEGVRELKAQGVPNSERPEAFGGYVKKGKERYEALLKAMDEGAGELPEPVQKARAWFFKTYYKTTSTRSGIGNESDEIDVRSNYRFRSPEIEKMIGKGEYENRFQLDIGEMRADKNYALKSGEAYYDPISGKPEDYSNSEVLFQQWLRASGGEDVKPAPLKTLKRQHVAGPGLPMLAVIQYMQFEFEKKEPLRKQDMEYAAGTDFFHAMLAVPNVVAAIWLLRDHGKALQIKAIQSITLTANKSIIVNYI